MPAGDGCGLYQEHRGPPVLPDPRKDDPEEPIRGEEPRMLEARLELRELLAKGQILKDRIGASLEKGPKKGVGSEFQFFA